MLRQFLKQMPTKIETPVDLEVMGEDQDVVLKRVAVNPVHDNNKPQHRNVLAPNQNKDKKPMQKHDNACINYGMNKH